MTKSVQDDQKSLAESTPRLVLPPLRNPVYRVSDGENPQASGDHRSHRANHYFWEWLDSLKAVRYF